MCRSASIVQQHWACSNSASETLSKTERKLAQVSISRVGSSRHRNKKLLTRIVWTLRILDEEQILPLQESRQAEIKSDGVDGHVDGRTGSKVVVGKLGDQ